MPHKVNDVITIKNNALETLRRYGIDEEFGTQMVGKSFVVKDVEMGYRVIEACGYDWYIPDDAIGTDLDPEIVKDFLNLL